MGPSGIQIIFSSFLSAAVITRNNSLDQYAPKVLRFIRIIRKKDKILFEIGKVEVTILKNVILFYYLR